MKLPLPKGLEKKLAPLIERGGLFLKEWEWTWTRAVAASIGICFFVLISMVIMPSFWMYLAEQKLRWGGPTDIAEAAREVFIEGQVMPLGWHLFGLEPAGPALKNQLRDAIAMGLTTGPFITFLVVVAVLQNTRRKLRGETGTVRPSGGYR
ncbi:MAG: hypothetical protein WD757_03465 [Actinomycetota bacterium]